MSLIESTLAYSESDSGAALAAVLEKKNEQIPHELMGSEKVPGSRMRYKIKVADGTFAPRVDEVLEDFRKIATLPGFRRGKAPARLVRARYARNAREEAVRKMVPRLAELVAAESKVESLAQPIFETWDGDEGKDVTLSIVIEVRPEINISDETLKGLSVEVTHEEVNDARVDEELKKLSLKSATYEAKGDDSTFETGDALTLDLIVTDNEGYRVPELSGTGLYSQNLEGELPKPVLEALNGKKKGDVVDVKDINVGTEANPRLVSYTIHVGEVKKRVLPAIDDEFAKDVSDKFNSLDDLRKQVREDLTKGEEQRRRSVILNGIYRELAKRLDFDLPMTLVQQMANRSVNNVEKRLNEYGMSLRNLSRNIVEGYLDRAAAQARGEVKSYLIADQVARFLDVKVTDEVVEQEIAKLAEAQGRKPLAVRAAMEKQKVFEQFKEDLRIRLVNDKLAGSASVKVVDKLSEPAADEAEQAEA